MRAIYATLAGLLVLATFCKNTQAGESAEIHWHHDLKTAIAEAEKSQKPLMVKFTASWCGFCKKMVRETFSDEQIADHVKCCYVAVSIDTDKYPELKKAMGVKFLPTTVVLTKDLQVEKSAPGFLDAQDFAKFLGPKCECETTPDTTKIGIAKISAGPELQVEAKPLAFGGVCLVSVVKDRKLTNGSADFTTEYKGTTLQFASSAHRDEFLKQPESYWPQYNGICPVTYRQLSSLSVGRPALAIQYKNKIYMCANREAARRFLNKPEKFATVDIPTQASDQVIRTAVAPSPATIR